MKKLLSIFCSFVVTITSTFAMVSCIVTVKRDSNATSKSYKPGSYKPGSYKPDSYKPDSYKPDSYKPDSYKPDSYKPDSYKPDPYKIDPYKIDPYKSKYSKSKANKLKSNTLPIVHSWYDQLKLRWVENKLHETKMHEITVQELGKKAIVENAIKKNFCNIPFLHFGVSLYEEMELYDSNSNTLIDFKNQYLIRNLSKINVKAILKYHSEEKFVSFNIKVILNSNKKEVDSPLSLMVEAEQKMNEKIINIDVKEFKNKQLVINGIIESSEYKQNILENDIKLINDFKFMDFLNNDITDESEFRSGNIIDVAGLYELNTNKSYLFFKIRLTNLSANSFPYSNGSTSQETDFILDFDDINNKKPIVLSRGWKGTLVDRWSMQEFMESEDNSYSSFDEEQKGFIEKFTKLLHLPASKESSTKFNNFLNQKRFLTFADLVNTINNHNLNSNENSYIDVPLALIRDNAIEPKAFEDMMLKIYNTLSYFFGDNYGYKILRTLAITKEINDKAKTLGITCFQFNGMHIKEEVLKENREKCNYDCGYFTAPNMYGTFVHEFGHVVDNFHVFPNHKRKNIDNISGLNNEYSYNTNPHNEYKQKYCDNCKKNGNNSPYRISTKDSNDKIESVVLDNWIDHDQALIDFIIKKVKNLDIPGKTAVDQLKFRQEMLLKIFINSDYGRTDLAEVAAEGFTYWLLTVENERTKAWEIWNEFFLDYLPKLREITPHFNDYLTNHN